VWVSVKGKYDKFWTFHLYSVHSKQDTLVLNTVDSMKTLIEEHERTMTNAAQSDIQIRSVGQKFTCRLTRTGTKRI